MPSRTLTVEEIMAILPETPGRLAAIIGHVDQSVLHLPPAAGEWSASDVLAHLRACSDVLGGNMLRIVAEDHPSWRGMSPRTWQAKSGYHDWQFAPAVDAFVVQRRELLDVLRSLPEEAWERTATVAVPPNKTFEYSVRYYGDWLAGHERAHLKTLPGIIAAAGAAAHRHPPAHIAGETHASR
jgi:hypothetical protein